MEQQDRRPNCNSVPAVASKSGFKSSLAEQAALRRGDVIVSVGGKPIRDITDFRDAMAKTDLKAGVRLQVKSQGARRFVFLKSSG